MSLRLTLFLYLLGLATAGLVALFQTAPGYMDADYYYGGGQRLVTGHGFSEMVLWNYLDDPAGLPHSSHTYWMPLASLLAAAGMLVIGQASFPAARLVFIVLAACIPPLTAALASKLTGRRTAIVFAGLLAAFPIFYMPFLATTDTFVPYMLLGGLFLLVAGRQPAAATESEKRLSPLLSVGLGLIAGLMHLARADGIVWLALALLAVGVRESGPGLEPWSFSSTQPEKHGRRFVFHLPGFILCLLGYLLAMGPWMLRNLALFGTLFSPASSRAIWITTYDELYVYPAGLLTFQHWWTAGAGMLLQARLAALGQNLQTFLAVQGGIFLLPLVLVGFWQFRDDRHVRLGSLAWLLTFLVMTLVFPLAGARGGFLHSGAAVQPLLWAAAAAGFDTILEWLAHWRSWPLHLAGTVLRSGLIFLAVFLSAFILYIRVIGKTPPQPAWGAPAARYLREEAVLQQLGAQPAAIVMVNNPPGYYAAVGRPAVVIPYGSPKTVWAAADRYHARYLILEFNQLEGPEDLYQHPTDRPGFHYLLKNNDAVLYQLEPLE